MKSILPLFLIVFQANIARSNSELNSAMTISHYDIDMEIFPSEHKFVSQVEMRIVDGDRTQNANQINFSLNAVKIHWVKDEHGNGIVHRYVKKQNKTGQLRLFPDAAKFDTMIVNIKYEGVSLGSISSHVEEKNSYLLFESDWYPQLTNFKENAFLFTYDLRVTVPKNQMAVCSGELDQIVENEGKICYYWKMSHPTFAISISSAEYEKQEYKFDELSITTYLYPEHKNHSDSLVTMFRNALEFFADEFGNFPFLDFKIVETNRRGGYSSAGMIMLSQDDIASFIKTNNYMSKFTLIHEIAHQWWAHKIIHDPWTDGFLNEAFAQYAAILYLENFANIELKIASGFLPFLPIKLSLPEMAFLQYQKPVEYHSIAESRLGTERYRWAAYYKGLFFLRALELHLGKSTFSVALREYLDMYKFKVVTYKQLQETLEKVSGKNLEQFFYDWIFTTKQCDYKIEKVKSKVADNQNYKVVAIIKNRGDMNLPVEVEFNLQDGEAIKKYVNEPVAKKHEIEIETKSPVISAAIDPEWKLLDANRTNNHFPRKRHFYFLMSSPQVDQLSYYIGPAITFGQNDRVRVGAWLTNIFPIELLKTTRQEFEWRLGFYYGLRSKKTGYSLLMNTSNGMPSPRWNYGIYLNTTRGAKLAQAKFSYNWTESHQIKFLLEQNNLYNISYFDPKDFEQGRNNQFAVNYQFDAKRYEVAFGAETGIKFFNGQYDYKKLSLTAHGKHYLFRLIYFRFFAGIINGTYPAQQSFFLSGSAKPSSWIYKFVDPDSKTSTQEKLHTRGDANLVGYFGQHIRGDKALSLNVELQILKTRPNLKLFADVGNVWNNRFSRLRFDAGIKFYLSSNFEILFPFYINAPLEREKKWDFRWVISFGD